MATPPTTVSADISGVNLATVGFIFDVILPVVSLGMPLGLSQQN